MSERRVVPKRLIASCISGSPLTSSELGNLVFRALTADTSDDPPELRGAVFVEQYRGPFLNYTFNVYTVQEQFG